jgi:hypothetical protein
MRRKKWNSDNSTVREYYETCDLLYHNSSSLHTTPAFCGTKSVAMLAKTSYLISTQITSQALYPVPSRATNPHYITRCISFARVNQKQGFSFFVHVLKTSSAQSDSTILFSETARLPQVVYSNVGSYRTERSGLPGLAGPSLSRVNFAPAGFTDTTRTT